MSDLFHRPRLRGTRLLLLCHAATQATRAAAFPADEAVDEKGAAAAASLIGQLPSATRVFASPARCARQTASILGLAPIEENAIQDCDYGRWSGRLLDEVVAAEPEGATSWLNDPGAAPHGGESITALIGRVGRWMDAGGMEGSILAVTHAAVVRAAIIHALDAPAQCFWRIDVPPLSITDLRRNEGRWTLRATRCRHFSPASE
jgi:broad specificity phosphatase PhoE